MSDSSSIHKILKDFMQEVENRPPITSSDLPDIDLYMDQVTTFMESRLEHWKRHSDDKVLTKTMINNYAKNKLLPSPDKKKYSREHILLMICIYYFKNILSINDIQKLITPASERYFKNEDGMNIAQLYDYMMEYEPAHLEHIDKDIQQISETASQMFSGCPEEEKNYLQFLSTVFLLSCDVYIKTHLIERLIDDFSMTDRENTSKQKS